MRRACSIPALVLALLPPIVAVAAPAVAQGANSLPLQRGFYVAKATACGHASNATLMLVARDGLAVSMVRKIFTRVEKTGPTTYQITQVEEDMEGRRSAPRVQVYEVPNRTSFSFRNQYGTSQFRYCAQSSLPVPWRTRDIRALID